MITPVRVEAYKCPVCNQVVFGTYKDAVVHANLPVGPELPLGLVYFRHFKEFPTIVTSKLDFGVVTTKNPHSRVYITLEYLGRGSIPFCSNVVVSSELFEEVAKGTSHFYTTEEFEEKKRMLEKFFIEGEVIIPLKKLVRTIESLEGKCQLHS